jgi:1-acyl-sn-glycerol-3-phosphate acyltransferase
MAYKIVRPVASIALASFFRKIYLSNTERIDWSKPLIIASNHPTAFTEPCILACFLEQPLHFLVRGDFFKKPFYAFLMRQVHLIPIFRMKDGGYKNLRQNFQTFDYCYSALDEGKNIMILAEGSTVYEKRLRPIQKGTARIVFGAMERFPDMDLQVIPVGVNFNFSNRFRSDVMITVQEPIAARDFLALYRDQPAQAINDLTATLENRMKEGVVHLDNMSYELLAERLWEMQRSGRSLRYWPVVDGDETPFREEKGLANWLNALDPDTREKLEKGVETYFDQLAGSAISDLALLSGKGSFARQLLLVLGAVPALLGRIGNWPPYWLARRIVDKKVKYIEFYGSVFIGICIGGYTLYYLLLLLLCGSLWGWLGLAGVGAVALSGLWYIRYYDYWLEFQAYRQKKGLGEAKTAELLRAREVLIRTFEMPI